MKNSAAINTAAQIMAYRMTGKSFKAELLINHVVFHDPVIAVDVIMVLTDLGAQMGRELYPEEDDPTELIRKLAGK